MTRASQTWSWELHPRQTRRQHLRSRPRARRPPPSPPPQLLWLPQPRRLLLILRSVRDAAPRAAKERGTQQNARVSKSTGSAFAGLASARHQPAHNGVRAAAASGRPWRGGRAGARRTRSRHSASERANQAGRSPGARCCTCRRQEWEAAGVNEWWHASVALRGFLARSYGRVAALALLTPQRARAGRRTGGRRRTPWMRKAAERGHGKWGCGCGNESGCGLGVLDQSRGALT